ncbi:MAG: hypothetical protein AYK19_15680 [Theionarchaea archaeon DG-70-1]|nr:MAG: hypothetical protein AYK19_15680 [Theionarchaea archaeon DG-70-1]
MKSVWMVVISVSVVCAFVSESCQWNQYLGNPGRTGYTDCRGPDSPEVFWEVSLPGYPDSPFITDGKIVVLCKDSPHIFTESKIAVVDLLTGTLLEENLAEVRFLTGAYPAGDLILGTTRGGRLYKIDPVSEEPSFDTMIPEKFSCFLYCYPIILPGKVVFPTTPAVCLSRDDYSILWNLETSLGPLYPINGKIRNIAASQNRIYIVLEEEERRIWAVDSDTGEFIWVSDTVKALNITAEGPVLFVGGDNLYALNAETGELLWESESGSICSNIVVGSDTVYAASFDRYLCAIDKSSGDLKWKTQWEGVTNWITHIVGAGDIIILSNYVGLFSFSAKDGTELWNIHFQSEIEMCPASADGILVVGEKMDYKLKALASDPVLFVKQGDANLSEGHTEEAISSYEKAAELYEKKGDTSRSQDVQERIHELENEPEPSPPTTPPEPSAPIPFFAVILVVVLMGILITYYLIKHKPKNG